MKNAKFHVEFESVGKKVAKNAYKKVISKKLWDIWNFFIF
jgi:hypothetical protein